MEQLRCERCLHRPRQPQRGASTLLGARSEGYSLGYSFSAPMAAASDSGAYYSSNVLSTQTDGAYNLTTPLSTPQRIPSHPLIFKTHL